jgi:hypothetical protein
VLRPFVDLEGKKIGQLNKGMRLPIRTRDGFISSGSEMKTPPISTVAPALSGMIFFEAFSEYFLYCSAAPDQRIRPR